MPGALKSAIGSRAGGSCSAKDLIWENETRSSRSARSIRTPATMSSSTDMHNLQDQGRTKFVTLTVTLTQWPRAGQAASQAPPPVLRATANTAITISTITVPGVERCIGAVFDRHARRLQKTHTNQQRAVLGKSG